MEIEQKPSTREQTLTPSLADIVTQRLDSLGVKQNENLGQHFLIDRENIDTIAHTVTPGNVVIEVGAGVGQLTEVLTPHAAHVTAVEIDRRFEPVLHEIEKTYPNVSIVYGDILAKQFKDLIPPKFEEQPVQVVANLPFHITEPFLHKASTFPFDDITLVVGQRLVEELLASSEASASFGRLTLLVKAYYDLEPLAYIEKSHFSPAPRTDAAIIRLSPKEETEEPLTLHEFVFKRLFDSERGRTGVQNVVKDAIEEYTYMSHTKSKKQQWRKPRRKLKADLKKLAHEYSGMPMESMRPSSKGTIFLDQQSHRMQELSLPQDIATIPFMRLGNSQLRELSHAIRSYQMKGKMRKLPNGEI